MTYKPKVLTVAKGGLNKTTLTANSVIYCSSTSAVSGLNLNYGMIPRGETGSAPTQGYITGTNTVYNRDNALLEIAAKCTSPTVYPSTQNLFLRYSPSNIYFYPSISSYSVNNPSISNIQGKTAGLIKSILRTSATNTNSALSSLTNALFGTTTGVSYTSGIPLYGYVILNDTQTSVGFALSRAPHLRTSPASAKIGKSGSAAACSTFGSMFLIGTEAVTAYDGNPVIPVGYFTATKTAANAWGFSSTAYSNNDLIPSYWFTFVGGQFGASAGTFFLPSGGTSPTFGSSYYLYYLNRNGRCFINVQLKNINVAGAGAVDTQITLPAPWKTADATSKAYCGFGYLLIGTTVYQVVLDGNGLTNTAYLVDPKTGTRLQNSLFAIGTDNYLFLQAEYEMTTD